MSDDTPTSVRGATAAVETAKAAEPPKPSLATVVAQKVATQEAWLRKVMPNPDEVERFQSLAITAARANPRLLECFSTTQGEMSFLLAVKDAAETGLEPNTPLQECWLQPRRNKDVMECELSIGYIGFLKLARNSGEIKTIFAEVVREGDEFRFARGAAEDDFYHQAAPSDQRGELTHAYAVARFMNGGYAFMVLDKVQVEQRRSQSESWRSEAARKFSPWSQWTEAMWRKSAIRALRPYLPLSAKAARAMAIDETVITPAIDVDPIPATMEDGPDE
jgi:recombination protein RecT